MLNWFLAASAIAVAPVPVQQNAAPTACSIAPVAVSFEMQPGVPLIPSFGWSPAAIDQVVAIGGTITEPHEKPVDPEGQLPSAKPHNRDPAQALPECREEPVKRRKRKNSYPMA
jgi:hypothetical protein